MLQAYLSEIRNPAAAAALFADEGVLELPTMHVHVQGPAEIEKFITGLLAKVPDFRFKNIRIWIETSEQVFGEYDVEAVVTGARHTRGLACLQQGLVQSELVAPFGLSF